MRVHRDWCFEAFVDVKILGAGDNLLSNTAGKPRYVVYSSRVCVENRCVSTPARKGHVEPRALDGARYFFLLCMYSPTCPFRVYKGKRKYSSPRSPNLPVWRQQQPPTSNEHSRIRSVSPHPLEASEQIQPTIWGGGKCKSGTARPTKHTKFKTNKLTTAASQGQSQKPQQELLLLLFSHIN